MNTKDNKLRKDILAAIVQKNEQEIAAFVAMLISENLLTGEEAKRLTELLRAQACRNQARQSKEQAPF